jgi:hypothetical protein
MSNAQTVTKSDNSPTKFGSLLTIKKIPAQSVTKLAMQGCTCSSVCTGVEFEDRNDPGQSR